MSAVSSEVSIHIKMSPIEQAISILESRMFFLSLLKDLITLAKAGDARAMTEYRLLCFHSFGVDILQYRSSSGTFAKDVTSISENLGLYAFELRELTRVNNLTGKAKLIELQNFLPVYKGAIEDRFRMQQDRFEKFYKFGCLMNPSAASKPEIRQKLKECMNGLNELGINGVETGPRLEAISLLKQQQKIYQQEFGPVSDAIEEPKSEPGYLESATDAVKSAFSYVGSLVGITNPEKDKKEVRKPFMLQEPKIRNGEVFLQLDPDTYMTGKAPSQSGTIVPRLAAARNTLPSHKVNKNQKRRAQLKERRKGKQDSARLKLQASQAQKMQAKTERVQELKSQQEAALQATITPESDGNLKSERHGESEHSHESLQDLKSKSDQTETAAIVKLKKETWDTALLDVQSNEQRDPLLSQSSPTSPEAYLPQFNLQAKSASLSAAFKDLETARDKGQKSEFDIARDKKQKEAEDLKNAEDLRAFRGSLEKRLGSHLEIFKTVFKDDFSRESIKYSQLVACLKALGGFIENKSGSARRIYLDSYIKGKQVLMDVYEPIYSDANPTLAELLAPAGSVRKSRPVYHKKHTSGHNERYVERVTILTFRRAFINAGLDARIIWSEDFAPKVNKTKSKAKV